MIKKIHENDLKTVFSEFKEKINGINVTVPFKKSVIPYLDKLSPEAEQTQSVNTIILANDILVGYNTDISGFTRAIEDLNFNIKGKNFNFRGWWSCPFNFCFKQNECFKIFISNRTKEKLRI